MKTRSPTLEPTLNMDQTIQLLAVYMDEWSFRNKGQWEHIYKLFYAALIVMFSPHIIGFLDDSILLIGEKLFYIIGILMSVLSLIYCACSETRNVAITQTIDILLQKLPKDYRRKHVYELKGKIFSKIGKIWLYPVLMVIMFGGLIAVGVALILR